MKRVGVKGLSPIIAVVVLLALAITVGVMVSIWMTGWISIQKESEEFGCAARTKYIIESAKYTSSTSVLRFGLTNKGEEGIYGFGVVLLNDTDIETLESTAPNITFSMNTSATNKLAQENSIYMSVNLSGSLNMGTTLTEVRVKNLACGAVTAVTDFIRQA